MDFEHTIYTRLKKQTNKNKQKKNMGECHRMCMKSSDWWKERNISK